MQLENPQPLEATKQPQKKCFFSEIQEFVNDLQFQSQLKSSSHYNGFCTMIDDGIMVISKGGTTFNIPLQTNIQNIFSLPEGILIEFNTRLELKFQDILLISKNQKSVEEVEEQNKLQRFSYATLNKHPLNSLKLLGSLKKNEDQVVPWLKSSEKIIFVSSKIPFMISYNELLKRHNFHIIRLNHEENVKDKTKLNFQNDFYLLNNLLENTTSHSLVVTELIYEDNNREAPVSKVKIIKGREYGEYLVLMLVNDQTSYVKVYQLNVIQSYQQDISAIQSQNFRLVNVISDCLDFFTSRILSQGKCSPCLINIQKKLIKQNKFDAQINKLLRNQSKMKNSFVTVHASKLKFSLYFGSHFIQKYYLSLQGVDLIEIQKQNATVLINDQKLRINVFPDIKDPSLTLVLQVLAETIDLKLFDKIFADVFINCRYYENIQFQDSALKQQNETEFENFVFYVVFLLKLCNKQNSSSQADFPTFQDSPSKKLKNLINQESTEPIIPTEQDNLIWKNMIEGTFHQNIQQKFKNFSKINQDFSPLVSQKPVLTSPLQDNSAQFDQNKEFNVPRVEVPLEQFFQNRFKILRILNHLFQELKLQNYSNQTTEDINFLLFCYTKYVYHENMTTYSDYYARQNPKILIRFLNNRNLQQLDSILHITTQQPTTNYKSFQAVNTETQFHDPQLFIEKEVPDIMQQLTQIWKPEWKQSFPLAFKNSYYLTKLFCLISNKQDQKLYHVAADILKKGYNHQPHSNNQYLVISRLFHNSQYPLFQANSFHSDQNTKTETQLLQIKKDFENKNNQFKALYLLIKRNWNFNTIKQFNQGIRVPIFILLREIRKAIHFEVAKNLPDFAFELIQREDMLKNINHLFHKPEKLPYFAQKVILEETINTVVRGKKFQSNLSENIRDLNKSDSKDLIFTEVKRILNTTQDLLIKQKYVENISEEKKDLEIQNILRKFSIRRLSCFPGQGAFNLGSQTTYITEVIKIAKINLSAIMPDDVRITLEIKDEKDFHLTVWPEFHNGVATGLQLVKQSNAINVDIIKTWIFYQKPETLEYEHGGFLLGLGILGYLESFSPTDIFQYLKQNHEATSVGILLGLSASRIGKADESTSKTLCLHIPFLLPPSYDVDIPLNVQTSALIGIGLIQKGTGNRLITEMTLAQIGRKPVSDKCLDREGYSLAAGFALGLVNLGKGANLPSIKDLQLEERLIRFIEGGKIMNPPQSILSNNFNCDNKCSSIREGNTVNTHITAPGALLALGLIYLKSNDKKLEQKILIPNSFSTLENCNPNHILLKVLIKNLIMWNSIKNTTEFVHSQIPQLIKFIYDKNIKEVYEKYYLIYNVDEIDFSVVTSVYVNIIGGVLLAIGLRFAGTGDQIAIQTIRAELTKFRQMKISKCELSSDPSNKNAIDQYTLFSLFSVCLLALSLINAGTCDVESLKLCRVIRKRLQDQGSFHYGFNMAINMAIGFLCLGRGNYSFHRSDMAIAALLISIYPQFPNTPNDNKCHLQALRHFYVFAVEQKILNCYDCDNEQQANVLLKIEFQQNQNILVENLRTPILLQESKKLVKIKVIDEEYYHQEIDFTDDAVVAPRIIYVKKKFIGGASNPKEQKESLDFASFQLNKLVENDQILDKNLHQYITTVDSQVEKLTQGLNKLSEQYDNYTKSVKISENQSQQLFSQINSEYLQQKVIALFKEDDSNLIDLLLSLISDINFLKKQSISFMQSLNLVFSFFENQASLVSTSSVFTLQQVNFIKKKIQYSFLNFTQNPLFKNYFLNPEVSSLNYVNQENFVHFEKLIKACVLLNIPNKVQLKQLKQFYTNLNNLNKTQQKQSEQQEPIKKSLSNIGEMYQLISFPDSCQEALNEISQIYQEAQS